MDFAQSEVFLFVIKQRVIPAMIPSRRAARMAHHLSIEWLESKRLLTGYTVRVVDNLNLISTATENQIWQAASFALSRISQLITWRGVLDTEVRVRPASENPNPDSDGLMVSIISSSWTADGWSNDTLQEMLTGVDPKPQSADAGMTIYLGRDGQIRNYGFLAWFDPNPIPYVPADVPAGCFDFIGVFYHEVFHGIGFLAWSKEFSALTTNLGGNDFFIGQATQQVFGGPLPLAPRVNGALQDHYGNTSLPQNTLQSGLMFQWGNYAGNRLDVGRLDLAVLQDLGISVKSTAGLPLVDTIDSKAPRNIISRSTVNENAVSGTAVGNLTTTRGTVGYAFSLVDGVDDNGFFRISGNTLLLNVSPDFESKGSYAIVVRNSDQGGAWTSTPLAVTVIDINESPTDIALSPAAILENQPIGSTVGTLTTTDPDVGNTFTYTLVTGTGSTDNASFNISGNQLRASASLDFETKSSYSVRVRSTDQGGLLTEKAFTVTVIDVNDGVYVSSGQQVVDASTYAGSVNLIKLGPGTLILDKANSHSGGTVVEAGEVIVKNIAALGAGTLDVRAGAKLTLDVGSVNWNGGSNYVQLPRLDLNPAGRLEIGTGQVRLAAGGYNLAAIRSALSAGRGDGSWNGSTGFTSAVAGSGASRAIGYTVLPNGSLQLGFAATGDMNVDGVVDFDDVVQFVSAGLYDKGLPARWDEGDLDYNGVVDFDDVVAMVSAGLYDTGTYLPTQPVSSAAVNLSALAEPAMQSLTVSQPEPVQATLDPMTAAFASLSADQTFSTETSPRKKQVLRVL